MKAYELMKFHNWAVVGDVLNNTKYAYRILNSLQKAKYNVIGVNPRGNKEEVCLQLADVPFKIDVIDLCINPVIGIRVVEEAKSFGIDKILIQPGAGSKEILEYCQKNDIIAIEGCALVELSGAM